jgi:hypothetical protein
MRSELLYTVHPQNLLLQQQLLLLRVYHVAPLRFARYHLLLSVSREVFVSRYRGRQV